MASAADKGIEFFDTAAAYGNGLSEEIIGLGLRMSNNSKGCIVCSKIPLTSFEERNLAFDADFESRVDNSLRRLGREIIDVLLIHNPPDNIPWSDFDRTRLDDIKNKGKIGTYGASSRSIPGAAGLLESDFGTCLEWVFSTLERRPIERLFPKAVASGRNFIARSPLSRGVFSSKRLKEQNLQFGSDDFRSTLPRDWLQWSQESARKIAAAMGDDVSLEQLALRFCLSYDAVSVVIPGIRNEAQLSNTLEAGQLGGLDQRTLHILDSNIERCFPGWK